MTNIQTGWKFFIFFTNKLRLKLDAEVPHVSELLEFNTVFPPIAIIL